MSCRRTDKTKRLVGCRIGEQAIFGCSGGCCPRDESKISENTRPHLLTGYPPEHHVRDTYPTGRKGLYYNQCGSSYRPKFVCPEKACRRSIKPFYDPSKFEYEISDFQDWSVRPLESCSTKLKAAFKNERRMKSRENVGSPETLAFNTLKLRYWNDPSSLSLEEVEYVKAGDPYSHWTKVVTTPRAYQLGPGVCLRCPSCGKDAVRVGSNFRIPPRKDDKAWRLIDDMIATGEDMDASFSPCPTIEDHKKMVVEAMRRRARENTANEGGQEKVKV